MNRTTPIWHNGIYLEPYQHMVIYAGDSGGNCRYMFNRVLNTFVLVHLVEMNDKEYLCFKSDIALAKEIATKENLIYEDYKKIG